ncbi:MAG: AmmeMemoRadiSam system protein A [Candidatus Mcinerneyibacterium aminivorans]|uniref:AmmeMemoRadiSam system protein A n=1 Tax=Candidatus Mcinerneyibacterium aminivorans TaxID=2703815 RepID=A0A5D0MBI5_9BACT|nr:MAG: AmmeMemoRadiSam system protein A [Candidatus Mcinerneyibacterium aminivorans]
MDKEKKELLTLARNVLENELLAKNHKLENKNKIFNKKRGVFVTLNNENKLRGCIGYIKPIDTIWNSIIKMAKSAAFKDPRFSPVTKNELEDLNIEISILSKLIKIDGVEDIKAGRDGLLIQKGFSSGVLLPQVATDNNWDSTTFLQNTCWKAGLNKNCYEDENVEIFRFEADVFSESELIEKR